jgi:hypothetical protein
MITTPFQVFAPIAVLTTGTTNVYHIFANDSWVGACWTTTEYSNLTTISSATAYVIALSIMWGSSDLSKFLPAYASLVAKQIGIPFTPTAFLGASSNLPQQTNNPSPPLSTAAKAGIGVGIVFGVALLIGTGIILTILFLRRRRRRRRRNEPPPTLHPDRPATPEMEDQDTALAARKWYLGGRWRSEAEAQSEAGELDGRNVRIVPGPPVELDAGERRG